jgi:hypothetical protein
MSTPQPQRVLEALVAVVVLRAEELHTLGCLVSPFRMNWDDAKGLCLCRAGGKENCDETARFHGGHPVGAAELGLCLVLSQCSQSPNQIVLDHCATC